MSEIALASGFGSIRRFNETFQTLFGRGSSSLRRMAGSEIPAGVGGRRDGAASLPCAV